LVAISRTNDNGFVLIGVIWLLVLAGAVGAALMLRSLSEARSAAAESRALSDRMALDGAAEAAFASLLFYGPRSTLASGGGRVVVGATQVKLGISSEALRFDVNEADPQLMDRVLQGLKLPPAQRNRIVAGLTQARSVNRRMTSQAELRRLIGPEAAGFEDVFTLYSGLKQPATAELPETLARRLAAPDRIAEPVEIRAGTALRIEAQLAKGSRLTAVARLTGQQDDPIAVQRWEHR
jgi:flagellar basal body-associated protein FliL